MYFTRIKTQNGFVQTATASTSLRVPPAKETGGFGDRVGSLQGFGDTISLDVSLLGLSRVEIVT